MADDTKKGKNGKGKDDKPSKTTKSRRVLPFPTVIDGGKSGSLKPPPLNFFTDRAKEKARSAKSAPVASAIKRNALSDEALDTILNTMAIEEGGLLFEQQEQEKEGVLDLELSDRRMKNLKGMADTILKRRAQMAKNAIDLNSAEFRKVLASLDGLFRAAMDRCSLPSVKSEDIMTAFADDLDDWEVRMTHELQGE